jgi:transcriptional regulator with XRE-family HTH domain
MPRRKSPASDAVPVGRRIRALREELGITLEKLAYESDLGSKGHLSDIEKGLVLPTVRTLRILADRLGVLPLDLLTDPQASLRERLIDRTRGLPATSLRKILAALSQGPS